MKYETFEKRVKAAGLTPRDCGNGHYRIEGGKFEVNWYPFSKRRTIYVNGLGRGNAARYGSIEEAIKLANQNPSIKGAKKAERKKSYRGVKLKLLKKDPTCHWCPKKLDEKTATIDHKIPLARGGSNASDNLVLACEECNKKKDNHIWIKENQMSAVKSNNLNDMAAEIYEQNKSVGWWTEEDEKLEGKDRVTLIASKLALVHSEISEALEGIRKNLNDDHLPHRPMGEVELGDTIIRILDLSGFMKNDIGGATTEKFEYNKQRADHKLENREKEGGKTI